MQFSLAQRKDWQYSYAIPESVFPIVWKRIAIIYRDCYSSDVHRFLANVEARAPSQLGLYSEGFRQSLSELIRSLVSNDIDENQTGALFTLLQVWKDYVVGGVENRHELIPELLKLIPLFVKIGAQEEASRLYDIVLSVSMGPSWYKESQFSIMNTALEQISLEENPASKFPIVAGYLERASGEMTFQRYIRHEKSSLIGELFRRGMYAQGIQYFKRQSCGSTVELLRDAQTGTTDRISPTVGMRFPGGALDEQHAVLGMVRNATDIDWKLRWALLEIFLCGDSRHITDYAVEYAKLINEVHDTDVVRKMLQRLGLLVASEISFKERPNFMVAFINSLDSARHAEASQNLAWFKVRETSKHSEKDKEDEDTVDEKENEELAIEQHLYLPGTFGRQDSIKATKKILVNAEQQLQRKNVAIARTEAVRALKILQDGGWSLWGGNLSSDARRAEELLREGGATADDLIRCYGPLIEGERYVAKWTIADHLIEKIGDRLQVDKKSALLDTALEHIHLMVGDSGQHIEMFQFLAGSVSGDGQRELFQFICWLADHPQWIRRDRAAALILWLIEDRKVYFEEAAQLAFSNRLGYGADISAGAIDSMSRRQSKAVWESLALAIDVSAALAECMHVGRLTTLHRIAEKAIQAGIDEANAVAANIVGRFRLGKIEINTSDVGIALPSWAECVADEMHEIEQLGLLTREMLVRLENELTEVCRPLSIGDAWALEKAVAQSFRERSPWPLDRWNGKVRFALGRALLPYASQQNFRDVEAVLRVYNPYTPERTLDRQFVSPAPTIVRAIEQGTDYKTVIGFDDYVYLNYYEVLFVLDDSSDQVASRTIDIRAMILPHPSAIQNLFNPALNPAFGAREFADFNVGSVLGPTCIRSRPDFAYFGAFTPAFPLPSFTDLIHAHGGDFSRAAWRLGRSYEVEDIGRPECEGSYLAVKRSAVRLPAGMQLVWIIKLDNELAAVIDMNNKRMG
jgi:hypothetical protein